MDTCETCRFAKINWLKGDKYMSNSGYGYSPPVEAERVATSIQCRRHAPVFSVHDNRGDGWPWVSGEDWCGEYQPEENVQ